MVVRAEQAIAAACAQLGRCLQQLGPHFPGDTSRGNYFAPAVCPRSRTASQQLDGGFLDRPALDGA